MRDTVHGRLRAPENDRQKQSYAFVAKTEFPFPGQQEVLYPQLP